MPLNAPHKRLAKRARHLVNQAVGLGKLDKPTSCSECKKPIILPHMLHGHHENYEKPLDVIWLCASCHKLLHLRDPLGWMIQGPANDENE